MSKISAVSADVVSVTKTYSVENGVAVVIVESGCIEVITVIFSQILVALNSVGVFGVDGSGWITVPVVSPILICSIRGHGANEEEEKYGFYGHIIKKLFNFFRF